MPENDLSLLVEAAHASADIARPFWRQSPKFWEKDDGAGPVTEADLAVNSMLKDTLTSARPDYGWLSEETEDNAARLSNSRVFIVDPIDGTRSFIAGEKTWSHSLAVAENGKVIAAAVYLPMLDKMYSAHVGGGAFLNGQRIQSSVRDDLNGATVLSARPNLDAAHWKHGTPPLARHFRSSLAYRLALIAEGRFDVMLTLRDTWEWDVAAGALLASEAGARVTDRFGAVPIFNGKTALLFGMLAGAHSIQEQLQAQLL